MQARHTRWVFAAAVAAAALLLALPAAAQLQTGNLYGVVADDQGSPLPGVTVTLTGQGAPAVQVTNAQGQFRFLGLSPGSYALRAELEGFNTVEYPNVVIRVGGNTNIEVSVSAAVEDVITVTAESPLLDERKISTGANINATELQKVPSARDPWAVLQTVPGVQMDRINVGGNEGGQQSQYVGPGSPGDQSQWAVDGVLITDMGAIGSSPTYYNFDAFEEMQATTGGSDATMSTGGVVLNMVTKRGTNEWRASGRFIKADESWQSDSDVDASDLGEAGPWNNNRAQADFKQGNRIVSVEDFGADVGGPIIRDRLWLWVNYGKQDIQLLTIADVADDTELDTYGGKLNAQVTSNNSGVFFYNYGDKIKTGRNASPTRPQETTWNQTGPTDIWKLEDTHIFSSDFYLTGLISFVGGGFQLTPQGGLDGPIPTLVLTTGIWQDNFIHHETERPQEQAKL
ncbi:MAG TPA: TonB-dependent receptor, partial [Thermoanaerobaculia bacterium]|nr:TonB-dependent receptor [Thermoanaerobaculia bacterium]